MSGYLGDVAALTRKDLALELRARDTLPAMLLFVLATLTVFHFALPGGAGDDAAYGLLWVAIVFTALLGLRRMPAKQDRIFMGKSAHITCSLNRFRQSKYPKQATTKRKTVSAANIGSCL